MRKVNNRRVTRLDPVAWIKPNFERPEVASFDSRVERGPRVFMKRILKQFVVRDAHPAIQFMKYGIAGGVATSVDVALFYLLALTLLPALQPDDDVLVGLARLYEWVSLRVAALPLEGWAYELFHLQVESIAEPVRERNYILNRCAVFLVSNFVAYVINALWVFTPGRHSRRKEITLFYTVAISSFIIGTTLGWGLISFLGVSTTQAYLANLVAAVLINYVCRKFLVFSG